MLHGPAILPCNRKDRKNVADVSSGICECTPSFVAKTR